MTKSKEDKFSPNNSIKLYGYDVYFNDLKDLFENKRFPKVVLLSGEKGIGKFTLAFHLINYFFTKESKKPYDLKNFTINTQSDFYNQILLNVNENFNYIGKLDNKRVSVENIREIKKKFTTSSLNNLPRFTVLDDADLFNANSANALLKLIEEPSDLNYFILINNKRKRIIDTLRSRSLEFKIFFSSNEKKAILENLAKNFDVILEPYSNFISKTTPGTLIKVSECLSSLKINDDKNLYDSVEILLDKLKKNKNEIYLESIKFLLDYEIEKKLKIKKYDFLNLSFIKKNITKLLFEYENFGLSKNSVLESFKSLPKNV